MVEYLEEEYEKVHKPVGRTREGWMQLRPGQNQHGYGRKITSDWMIKIKGSKRLYRAYITCYSNAGSVWIMKGGKQLFLRDCD